MIKPNKFRFSATVRSVILAALALAIAGCATPAGPTSYYLLHATPQPTAPRPTVAVTARIGVGPITVPDYLARSQIVTREGPNRIKLAQDHRWAAPLSEQLTKILARNLGVALASDQVYPFPWNPVDSIALQIPVNITSLIGKPGTEIKLAARWRIVDTASNRELANHTSRVVESVPADTYAALVAAIDRAVSALSRDIAAAVKSNTGTQ